jgi:predicted lipoprotein
MKMKEWMDKTVEFVHDVQLRNKRVIPAGTRGKVRSVWRGKLTIYSLDNSLLGIHIPREDVQVIAAS